MLFVSSQECTGEFELINYDEFFESCTCVQYDFNS
jgi:hypothetical protein